MSSLIFTSLSQAEQRGDRGRTSSRQIHGKHIMERRKNHVDVGISSVIKFGRSDLYP